MNLNLNQRVPINPIVRLHLLIGALFAVVTAAAFNAIIFRNGWMTFASIALTVALAALAWDHNEDEWQVTRKVVLKEMAILTALWLFCAIWSIWSVLTAIAIFTVALVLYGWVVLFRRSSWRRGRPLLIAGTAVLFAIVMCGWAVTTIEGNPLSKLSTLTLMPQGVDKVYDIELDAEPAVGTPVSFELACGRAEHNLTTTEINEREFTVAPFGCRGLYTVRLSWPGSETQ